MWEQYWLSSSTGIDFFFGSALLSFKSYVKSRRACTRSWVSWFFSRVSLFLVAFDILDFELFWSTILTALLSTGDRLLLSVLVDFPSLASRLVDLWRKDWSTSWADRLWRSASRGIRPVEWTAAFLGRVSDSYWPDWLSLKRPRLLPPFSLTSCVELLIDPDLFSNEAVF